MLNWKFFVDNGDVDIWGAVPHICLRFKREARHGSENHRNNEGLILSSFSPVSSLMLLSEFTWLWGSK